MPARRFGDTFPRLFAAALFQELCFAFLIHIPGYFENLGATEGRIGLLFSVCAVASLLMRPLLGRILDKTHRRTVLLIAGPANAIVVLILATTETWGPYLWAIFLVQRVLQLGLFTTIITYAADAIPVSTRTQGLAIYGLSGLVPIAGGGFFGDVVIDGFGFGGLFVGAAISMAISWGIVWTMPTLPIRTPEPRRSFWAAFAQRNLLPLWFGTLMFAIGMESVFTFTRTYVADRGVGSTGVFFAAYGTVAALTRIVGGRVYDVVPHRPMLVSSLAFYGLGLGAMAFAEHVAVLVIAAGMTGMAHGAAFPLLSSEVVNRARESERGSAMSIFTALFDVALLLGAPLVGLVIDLSGYRLAFSVAGVALVLGALTYLIWDRRSVAAELAMAGEEV
ncbi:MAG TPA: MFS transporter [Acidimicrobiia bacterium]